MSEVLTALWAKDGQKHLLSIKEWSELTGLDAATIRQRISTYHWAPEKAVNTSSHGGRLHTYRGEERTLPQIARENGMNIRTFVDRVRRGSCGGGNTSSAQKESPEVIFSRAGAG